MQSWQIVICCLLVKRRSTVISPIAVDELHRDVFLWKENVSLAKILNWACKTVLYLSSLLRKGSKKCEKQSGWPLGLTSPPQAVSLTAFMQFFSTLPLPVQLTNHQYLSKDLRFRMIWYLCGRQTAQYLSKARATVVWTDAWVPILVANMYMDCVESH